MVPPDTTKERAPAQYPPEPTILSPATSEAAGLPPPPFAPKPRPLSKLATTGAIAGWLSLTEAAGECDEKQAPPARKQKPLPIPADRSANELGEPVEQRARLAQAAFGVRDAGQDGVSGPPGGVHSTHVDSAASARTGGPTAVPVAANDYESERAARIAQNAAFLDALGLGALPLHAGAEKLVHAVAEVPLHAAAEGSAAGLASTARQPVPKIKPKRAAPQRVARARHAERNGTIDGAADEGDGTGDFVPEPPRRSGPRRAVVAGAPMATAADSDGSSEGTDWSEAERRPPKRRATQPRIQQRASKASAAVDHRAIAAEKENNGAPPIRKPRRKAVPKASDPELLGVQGEGNREGEGEGAEESRGKPRARGKRKNSCHVDTTVHKEGRRENFVKVDVKKRKFGRSNFGNPLPHARTRYTRAQANATK